MESIAGGIPATAAMPRLADGTLNLQELIRRLAEDVANGIMDAEADQMCEASGNSRNGYRERSLLACVGKLTPRVPELRCGSLLPEDVPERYQRVGRASGRPWPRRAPPARAPGKRGASPRRRASRGSRRTRRAPSPSRRTPTRPSCRAEARPACPRPISGWARPTQVPAGGPRGVHGRRDRDRPRRGRPEARPGDVGRRHRVLRLVARVPARGQVPRRPRRPPRRVRRPPGPRQGGGRGLPGRRLAALRGAPDARPHARGRLPAAGARVGRILSPALRAEDAGAAVAMHRVACDMLAERRPKGGGGPRGGGARRPRLPRLPRPAPEAPEDQQRAGEGEPGDRAQAEGGAGAPVGEIAREARRRRDVRDGRVLVVLALLLGGEDAGARGARPRGPTGPSAPGGSRGRAGPSRPAWSLPTGSRRHGMGS